MYSPAREMLVELANSSGSSVWSEAARAGIEHVLLVLGNNPNTDLAEIFARPDIQDALVDAGAKGSVAVVEKLRDIWDTNGGASNSPYLSQLVDDARRNGQLYPTRVQVGVQELGRENAKKVLYADKVRAAAATAVAETRAKAEASVAELYAQGVRRVKWVANFKNGHLPCKWCRYLNNQVVNIGDVFRDNPELRPLPVYGDMSRPPRHPNCQCKIVKAD